MSYCVNCGVELDRTCKFCPLCSTPVLNPNQPVDLTGPGPFPKKRGTLDPVDRKEVTILISIILCTTSLVCFILNQMILTKTSWSLYTIGICAVLWIFLLPYFFPNMIHPCLTLLLDGISIAAFLGAIACLHPGNGWYYHIALPVTALATLSILVFYVFTIRHKSSLIMRSGLLIGNVAVLCVVIELLIHYHYQQHIRLTWSAIVLTCCAAIDVVLIAIACMKGLRAEVRRRMHF